MVDKPMKETKIIKQLEALAASDDYEMTHAEADKLLCELLKALGYEDVVEAYERVGKWYS